MKDKIHVILQFGKNIGLVYSCSSYVSSWDNLEGFLEEVTFVLNLVGISHADKSGKRPHQKTQPNS